MGNKGAKGQKSQVMENEETVVNHSRIQNVTIKRTNKNHQYMETHLPITDKKDYDQWIKALKSSPGEESPYALHPRKHSMKKQGGMCGKSGDAIVQYDNYSYTLKDQIRNRQKSDQKKFEQTQLWYMLNGLADVSSKFYAKKLRVGDIRPENIFISNSGELKVATQHSWPRETSNYQKYIFDHENTYLAPEQLNDVQVGRNSPTSNPETADSFSIGLTALDSALLEDSSYNLYQKNSFVYDVLEEKRRKLNNLSNYSELLKLVINNLTSPQFGKRLTPRQLKEFLAPNQARILQLQNFTVDDIPYKLKQNKNEGNGGNRYESQRYSQAPRVSSSFEPKSRIEYRESLSPTRNKDESKYRLTLAEIEQKIAKSKAMNP